MVSILWLLFSILKMFFQGYILQNAFQIHTLLLHSAEVIPRGKCLGPPGFEPRTPA